MHILSRNHKNQEAKKPRRTKATKQKARRAKNPKATKAKKPARKAKEVEKQNSVSKCVKYVLIFDVFGCLDMRHLFLYPQTGVENERGNNNKQLGLRGKRGNLRRFEVVRSPSVPKILHRRSELNCSMSVMLWRIISLSWCHFQR
jgi:hypothetical protein